MAEYLGVDVRIAPNDPISREFLEHGGAHRFVTQRCRDCGLLQYPPGTACEHCVSSNYEWAELSGRGNLVYQARAHGLAISREDAQRVLHQIKELEHAGFTFEAAEASVDLMLHRTRSDYQAAFELIDFMVVTEHRQGRGLLSEATVKVRIREQTKFTAAEGNGPVNALALALRSALLGVYPELEPLRLTDYKVRILDSKKGTAATTRVLIDFQHGERSWTTVGASSNIIEASWRALSDSMEYALLCAWGVLDTAGNTSEAGASGAV